MLDKFLVIANDVYKTLGCGFDETIYQKAIEVGCRLSGIAYEPQRIIPIFYKDHNIGEGKIDFILKDGGNTLLVEIKAIQALSDKDEAQLQTYMKSLNMNNGLLLNFPQIGTKKKADALLDIEYKVVGEQK